MIFPSGKRKNLDVSCDPLSEQQVVSPRSPDYVPELKKNAKRERYEREAANDVQNPRSIDYQPQMKSGKPVQHDWAVAAVASKMSDSSKNMIAGSHTIGSARAGGLSDIGGPIRQMQTATSNSIWDVNVLDKIKKGEIQMDKGEQIKADNAALAEKRDQMKKTNFHIDVDSFVQAYKRGDMAKGSSIQVAHVPTEGQNYSSKIAPHELSIFKSEKVYNNLPDKTAGESIKESAEARRNKGRKDRSWETVTAAQNTKQKLSAFFDNIKKSEQAPPKEGK